MNIFVTSPDPLRCAINLDNRRVIKMILESAQILSTNIRYLYDKYKYLHDCEITKDGVNSLYKTTHINHPCTVWARDNLGNHRWLVEHLGHLLDEYTYRYGKTHKTTSIAKSIRKINIDKLITIISSEEIKFVNCSAHKAENVFVSYQLTMIDKWESDKAKGYTPNWTKRSMPDFYNAYLRDIILTDI